MSSQPEDRPGSDLPPSLEQALFESASYALRLRTGELVRFSRAERHGLFVVLHAADLSEAAAPGAIAQETFPNGLHVRISDIVWCARGPAGALEASGMSVTSASERAHQQPGVRVPLRIQPPNI
jgi:hypothetical protein